MKNEKGRVRKIDRWRQTPSRPSFSDWETTSLVDVVLSCRNRCCQVTGGSVFGGWRGKVIFGQFEVLTKTLHVTPAISMNNSEHRRMYGEIRQDTEAWNLASSNKKKKKGNRRKKIHVQGEAIREIHTDLTYGMIMNILSNSLKRTHTRRQRMLGMVIEAEETYKSCSFVSEEHKLLTQKVSPICISRTKPKCGIRCERN